MEIDWETDSEADPEIDSEADPEIDTETDSERGSENGPEIDVETESERELGHSTPRSAGCDCEADSKIDVKEHAAQLSGIGKPSRSRGVS